MRLGLRIGFFVALTAILPLLLLAFAASQVARNQVEARIVDYEVEAARSLGAIVSRQLIDTQRVLAHQVANFRLDAASDDARAAFLVATYRLFPEISIALLLDSDGAELSPPLYLAEVATGDLAGHDAVSPARLQRFREALPAPSSTLGDVSVGEPYLPDGAEAAVLPLVFASPWPGGVALAVELSLAPVASRMGALAEGREVCLLGREGQVLLRIGTPGLVDPASVRPILGNAEADLRYVTTDGVDVLAAMARVPHREWAVVIAEPADAVTATVEQIQARTWYVGGVALIVALIGGTYLARSITGPVVRLRDAAHAVGRGEFSRRTSVDGGDELAELASAFNRMSASLEQNASEIASKNEEIEQFNRELQARVDRRTAQLREAQASLVQSGQLAAIGELSAGLAHELNNPVAGILGIVQILLFQLRDRPEAALLRSAEAEAVRCKEIVANLLRFTRPQLAVGAEGVGVVDLLDELRGVLGLVAGALRERGVTVELETGAERLPMQGDPSQLGRALGQLFTSLRAVAQPGSTLRIRGEAHETEVELLFELSPTTPQMDDWRAAGLGFWVARQVLQEHSATLEEPGGEPGGLRVWRLRAPRVAEA